MSITFPTLDLGELGQALDDAIAAEPEIAAEEAPTPDAAPLEAGVSAVAAEPAAGAGAEQPTEPVAPEADAAYAARFEADYAERSKADFAGLRSKLDKQIGDLRSKHTMVSDAAEEAENYAAYLESKLAEYDPDEVAGLRKRRESIVARRKQKVSLGQLQQENRRAFRDREFRRLYPDLDPYEPSLVEAFEAGDAKLEGARIMALQAQAQLAKAQAAPTPVAAAPAAKPETKARDAGGRFLPAEQTRAMEKLRGDDGLARTRGGGFPAEKPTTVAGARRVFQDRMAELVGRPR